MRCLSPKGRTFPERKVGDLDVGAPGDRFLDFLDGSRPYQLGKIWGKTTATGERNAARNNKTLAMYYETARAELILLCLLRRLLELPIGVGPFQLPVGRRVIKSRLPKLVFCLRIRAGVQELDENVGILAVSRREQERGLINVILSVGVGASSQERGNNPGAWVVPGRDRKRCVAVECPYPPRPRQP